MTAPTIYMKNKRINPLESSLDDILDTLTPEFRRVIDQKAVPYPADAARAAVDLFLQSERALDLAGWLNTNTRQPTPATAQQWLMHLGYARTAIVAWIVLTKYLQAVPQDHPDWSRIGETWLALYSAARSLEGQPDEVANAVDDAEIVVPAAQA